VRHTLALGHRDALEAVRRLGVATLRLSEAFLLILRTAGHGRRESVRRLSMCGPCVSHLSAFAHVGGAGVLLARRGEGKMKINACSEAYCALGLDVDEHWTSVDGKTRY
jgi:hypothetical protein